MESNADKARKVLEDALSSRGDLDVTKTDLYCVIAEALGWLRGYELPAEAWAAYRCTFCGAGGVKLWRAAHSDSQALCSRCGTAQAGLPDDVDENGRRPSEYSSRIDRKSDQIYSPEKGLSLLPYVPCPDGGTWGYTSVPPEGCHWWRSLPTRKE